MEAKAGMVRIGNISLRFLLEVVIRPMTAQAGSIGFLLEGLLWLMQIQEAKIKLYPLVHIKAPTAARTSTPRHS